jgi:cytochrome c oxidase cbb3-type subunit 3
MSDARKATFVCACVLAGLVACQREERRFTSPPDATKTVDTVQLTPLHAGNDPAPLPIHSNYQENAYAMSQGKQLFSAFNCNGCHGNGGGGMGPALMDDVWIYGSDPANVFTTIVEGRPNGMPSFRGRITNDQVWQLVAYVRSMSGLASSDAAPGRNDRIEAKVPESRIENPPPVQGGTASPKG